MGRSFTTGASGLCGSVRLTAFVTLTIVSVGAALGGCNTATIVRASGPPIEAEIAGSDADTIYLKMPNGKLHALPRDDVYDIDHPGNVLAIVGASLSPIGIASVAFGVADLEKAEELEPERSCGIFGDNCEADELRQSANVAFVTGGIYLAASAAMVTAGLWQWVASTNAADGDSPPQIGMWVDPAGNNGVAVGFSF